MLAGSKSEIPALTGIRALAAWWVVTMHFWKSLIILLPSLGAAGFLVGGGNYGVDLFFLLSGLILMHVYGSRSSHWTWVEAGDFVRRRFARIYPAYFAALVGLILMVGVADRLGFPKSSQMYPMESLPYEFLMLQAWGPSHVSWNYPSWSVSAEWFAYLFIFPVALGIFHRLGSGGRIRYRMAAFLAVVFLALLAVAPHPEGLPNALVRVSAEFLAGAMLYRVLEIVREKSRLGNLLLAGGAALLIGLFSGLVRLPAAGENFFILAALGVILLAVGIEGTVAARWLSRPYWVYLGEISYALYLVHAPIQRALKVLLPAERFADAPLLVRVGVFLVYGAALVAASAAMYHLVEKPARNFLTARRG